MFYVCNRVAVFEGFSLNQFVSRIERFLCKSTMSASVSILHNLLKELYSIFEYLSLTAWSDDARL